MMAALDPHRLAKQLGGEVAGGQILAPGPGHSARDRSLAVRLANEAPDGFVVFSHSGDDALACRDHVRQAAGLPSWQPATKTPERPVKSAEVVATYIYQDAKGDPFLRVQRTRDKSFLQARWEGGGWKWGKPRGPKLPYRLPELMNAHTVYVVEGEKDADRLADFGLCATTASEGAGKWTPDLAQWFEGKTVCILPDNDQPGRDHAATIAHSLSEVAEDVRVVHLPNLRDKGDVSDWLDAGGSVEALESLCEAAPAYGSADNDNAPAPWARRFQWVEPSELPPRQWLYGGHLIRKFASATFSPGGVGKSSLTLVEALAMASGRPLLGHKPAGRLRVAVWNGEDPLEETQRRVMAAALHYGLTRDDLEGWLFIGSGREAEIIIAEQTAGGATVMAPNVERVTADIRSQQLDVVIVDPFVSTHRVTENDNGAVDLVAKTWARIADQTNTAVELVHHTRKTNGAETTVEDGRGASSLLYAVRSARVLNVMSQDEADKLGLDQRRSYFRADNGKANLAPPPEGASWFRMASVKLGNGRNGSEGDWVGVVTPWSPPDPFEGVSGDHLLAVQKLIAGGSWRENHQANDWAGRAVAEALSLDADDRRDRQRIKGLLATWIKTGALVRVLGRDATTRKERPMIEVGTWANG